MAAKRNISTLMEGMPGELDIFEKPVFQACINSGNWYQFKPTTSISDSAQLEFRVPGQGDYYIDLEKTLLNIKLKIVKTDSTHYNTTDIIAPINNVFDGVFSDVKVEFNQKQVSDSRNMYHYRAYLEDLFNYNSTAKESHQTASLWCQDTPGEMDSTNSKAFKERLDLTKGSQTIDLAGKLHCDMFNVNKYLLNDVSLRLLFVKGKSEVCVMKDLLTTPGKIQIVDATLWIRKVKINPSILLAHANNLNLHTAKYPFKRVELQNHTLPQGTQQHTIENLFLGRIPTRVMVGLVSHASFSGDYSTNPFNFQHFNLNYLSMFKNGEQLFCRPYVPDYGSASPSYAIPYIQSFFNTGNNLCDDGYCVGMKDWKNGYCIYPFDLTPDLSANEQFWCVQEQGNLRLELGFATALAESVTIIVYAEFREVLEINKDRECSLE